MSFSLQRVARKAFFLWLFLFPVQVMVAVAYPDLTPTLSLLSKLLILLVLSPGFYNWLRGRSVEDDQCLFLGELSLLTARDIPLDQALAQLAQARRRQLAFRFAAFTPVLTEISRRVSSGSGLSEAMRGFKEIPQSWADWLRDAELRDDVPRTLRRLADIENTRLRLPILTLLRAHFLLVMLLGVSFFLADYILPSMVEVLEQSGLNPAWSTQLILSVKKGMVPQVLLFPWSLLVLFLFLSIPFPGVRDWLRQIAYYLPGFRRTLKSEQQARATAAMAVASHLGFPLSEVLSSARAATNLRAYRRALTLKEGDSLWETLAERPQLFDSRLLWLCRQGEALDRLPEALEAAGRSLEQEYRQRSQELIVALDTLVLLVLGAAVATVAIGSLLPYYQFIDAAIFGVLP